MKRVAMDLGIELLAAAYSGGSCHAPGIGVVFGRLVEAAPAVLNGSSRPPAERTASMVVIDGDGACAGTGR